MILIFVIFANIFVIKNYFLLTFFYRSRYSRIYFKSFRWHWTTNVHSFCASEIWRWFHNNKSRYRVRNFKLPRRTEGIAFIIVLLDSCHSYIGLQKNEQLVTVHGNCQAELGAMQHPFLHALGLIHEQARPDRDHYVWMNFKNINSGKIVRQFFL